MESQLIIEGCAFPPGVKHIGPSIKQACDHLYAFYRHVPEYILLNPDDYEALCEEFRQLQGMANDDKIIQLAGPDGNLAWTFPMPEIPREKEHSEAHLAFAEAECDMLPVPNRGTMLILYRKEAQS